MQFLNTITTIAYRDFIKFTRDRGRIIATFIFPFLFIGILGGSLQSNLGDAAGYNFLTFVFVGVLAQTLFQSTASGIISLIEDRKNDFSQELFVSPVSRYSIVFGKITGETIVSLAQAVGILLFGLIIGVPLGVVELAKLFPVAVIACLFGGAFGVIVLSNLQNERSAQQIFPFVIFPQFFLAGVFNPIKHLPLFLDVASHLAPMRYAVDLMRGVYYWGTPEYDKTVIYSPLVNLAVITTLFLAFLAIGTLRFAKSEKNR